MFQRAFIVKTANKIRSADWRNLRTRLLTNISSFEELTKKISSITCEKISFNTDNYLASLYWVTHPDPSDKNCVPFLLAIEPIEGILLPSLMACWLAPGCIPIFTTCIEVIEKLYQGADLMAPGIIGNVPDVELNEVVGVSLIDDPGVVLAIGIAQLSGSYIRGCKQGKAVKIIQSVGDRLWLRCGKPKIPLSIEQGLNEISLAVEPPLIIKELENLSEAPVSNYSENEIIEALLIELPEMELPISGSAVQCKHLSIQLRGLDFRRTKWKSLSKFLRFMEKQKLIITRERQGELLIASFDIKHELFDTIIMKPKKKLKEENSTIQNKKMEDIITRDLPKITVETIYKPTQSQISILGGNRNKNYFTEIQVETALREYVKNKKIIEIINNLEMIYLSDANLCSALKINKTDNKISETITFLKAKEKLIINMKRMHRTSTRPADVWPGDLKRITVKITTKQKKRTLTVISNIQPFLILERLQQDFSVLCASSVSIDNDKILIQGSQFKIIKQWVKENGLKEYVDFEE